MTKRIAKATDKAVKPRRTCIIVEGFGVPHVHIRVNPLQQGQYLTAQIGSEKADVNELKKLAEKIRGELE